MPWEGALYRRDKLYEQVWLEPLRSVARQYGISDVERQRRDAAELEHEAATRQRAVCALSIETCNDGRGAWRAAQDTRGRLAALDLPD